ncbi:alpha/beta hydrolase [Amycolatopsis sp. cmx-4-61]|uniref:alpha/beta hydrolase n=1 Tax=Amycolatopsis sp. cmx-4-61 TaxID=2790937 RepID=UPI0039785007
MPHEGALGCEPRAILATRAHLWIAAGVDARALGREFASVAAPAGTEVWVSHFSARAARSVTEAAARRAEGDRAAARRAYRDAAFWFFLARFPVPQSAAAREAYLRSLDMVRSAASLENPALRVVGARHGDGEVVGHLRLPAQANGRAPLIVLIGSAETYKADVELAHLADAFHAAGAATLAVDSPGTGESTVAARPGAETAYEALLRQIEDGPSAHHLDTSAIGVVGVSFGAHWSLRLAAGVPHVAAAVTINAPLHHAFAPDKLAALSPPARDAVSSALRVPPEDVLGLQRRLAELSLLAGSSGNLLLSGRPKRILALAGGHTEFVLGSDDVLLMDVGWPADLLLYESSRYGKTTWIEYTPTIVTWLLRRLDECRRHRLTTPRPRRSAGEAVRSRP